MNEYDRKKLEELQKRRKIVWVNAHELIGLFIGAAVACGSLLVQRFNLQLPVIEDMPDGVLFHSSFYEPMKNSWGIVVLHESFDKVPDHVETPELNGKLGSRCVAVEIKGCQTLGGRIHLND